MDKETKSSRIINGYNVIYKPDHFHHTWNTAEYSGWVYEHRYVVECFLNRPLSSSEIVHHKDGNKLNNDISNLEVTTRSSHAKEHLIRRGCKVDYRCVDCGKSISVGATRCTSCSNKHSRECRLNKLGLDAIAVPEKPDKYSLLEEVKSTSYIAVAKKYGVSATTIENWLEDLYKPKKRSKI